MTYNLYKRKDQYNDLSELEEQNYKKKLYTILARYMIVHGEYPQKFKDYYKFYSKQLGLHVRKGKQYEWLCQIARIIERNEHKAFDLKTEVLKSPAQFIK